MIAEGQQNFLRNQEIANPSSISLKQTNLSKPEQQAVFEQIKKSNRIFQQIAKKQVVATSIKDPLNEKIRNLLSPLKSVNYQSIMSYQKLTKDKYRQFSIMPEVQKIVIDQLAKFIEIQTTVDVFTKKLVTMPSKNITVMDFVSKILQYTTLIDMYENTVKQMLTDKINQQQVKQTFFKPILQKILTNVSKVGYQIDLKQMVGACMNSNLPPLVYSSKQVNKIQTKAFETRKVQNEKQFSNVQFFQSTKNYLLKMIKRKKSKQTQPQHFFHEIQEQDLQDYSDMVIKAVQAQVTQLKVKQNINLNQME